MDKHTKLEVGQRIWVTSDAYVLHPQYERATVTKVVGGGVFEIILEKSGAERMVTYNFISLDEEQ